MQAAAIPTGPTASAPVTLLIGNPNVGKSVLFGRLTGRYTTVSNYPGTTVEIAQGRDRRGGGAVIDLPGTTSLLPTSEDERITRDAILTHGCIDGARAVLVCDAKNLRRGLALALQLAELELPLALVANMTDEASARGLRLDSTALGEALGVDVLPAVATRGEGLAPLLAGAVPFRPVQARVDYGPALEAALARLEGALPAELPGRRGLALMLLASPDDLPGVDGAALAGLRAELQAGLEAELPEGIAYAVQQARQAAADTLAGRVLTRGTGQRTQQRRGVGAVLGDLALHPLWGIPVALAVLYAMYLFVGVLGAGKAVDFLERVVFNGHVVPWLDGALRPLLPAPLEGWLIGPAGVAAGHGPGLLLGDYGLVSMGLTYAFAIVLPIVGFFFLAFSALEDSGYLPRLAVVLNRAFKLAGLNGKAVLPMILGLGCDTMATMTARILPTPKERLIVTMLLALGVPCSAQLGVIMGMLAALSTTALLWWLGTVIGVMLVVGALAARVLPGESSAFVLEIPPLRRPALGNIAVKTLARMEWYLREVVPLFVLGTFLLWLLDALHLLRLLERLMAPLVQGLLGLPPKASEAFLIGFLRRDYGAAGLYDLFKGALASGHPSAEVQVQIVVALVTMTLFVPCVANFLMIVRERGVRTGLAMAAFIFPFAFAMGGALNFVLRGLLT
ncbi:MAG TPA: ferrous iron transporter B [bacterium]|nr:ferrous iron transporter B [bacterium]